jgi:hypothetical protein
MLKVGGELKVGTTEVLSAIRAALANRLGLFELPDEISRRMEEYAENQSEIVGAAYYELRAQVTEREYAEVLSVMGIKGHFMNNARRKTFLQKTENFLPALREFNNQLVAWQQSLRASLEPNIMLGAMSAMAGGGLGMAPAGLVMAQPDTAPLRDAAESVIDAINKVFGGLGVPVARALAYDATRIRQVLENPALPAALGMPNREQMIRNLNIEVSADVVRLERSLAQFALAVMELKNVTPGRDEQLYLGALFQLGATIPWDKIGSGGMSGGKPAGLGGRDRRTA